MRMNNTNVLYKYHNIFYFISAFFGIILINYSILNDYAFVDAYESLWTGNTSEYYFNNFIVGGRPLYGYLSVWIFRDLIHTIEGLKWLRLFSVFTSTIFSFQILYFLKNNIRLKFFESSLLSFLILCLPSFTVYIGWSITFEIPIGLSASLLAGQLLYQNYNNYKRLLWNFPLSVILVISSLSLYQSASTAFLIPLVLHSIYKKEGFVKLILLNVLLFVLAFSLYFVMFKFLLFYYEMPGMPRSNIDIWSLPQRIIGYYSRELPNTISSSGIILFTKAFKFIGLVLFVIFIVQNLISIVKRDKSWLVLVFQILVLPISYFSNLISVDDWISMRTMAIPTIIIFIYQYEAIRRIIIKFNKIKYAGFAISLIVMSSAFYNQNYAFAGLQTREYKCLRTEIESAIEKNPSKIIVIRPPLNFAYDIGYIRKIYCDEFGVISSSRSWVPIPLINQIVKEEKGVVVFKPSINHEILSNYYTIGNYSNQDTIADTTDAIVLDFGRIIKKEIGKAEIIR